MLSLLQQKLDAATISNVEPVHAEADRPELPNAACALVFLANVWHEFEDRDAVLRETRRILPPVGESLSSIGVRMSSPFTVRLWSIASHYLTPLERCSSPVSRSLVRPQVGLYSWLVQGEKQQ